MTQNNAFWAQPRTHADYDESDAERFAHLVDDRRCSMTFEELVCGALSTVIFDDLRGRPEVFGHYIYRPAFAITLGGQCPGEMFLLFRASLVDFVGCQVAVINDTQFQNFSCNLPAVIESVPESSWT